MRGRRAFGGLAATVLMLIVCVKESVCQPPPVTPPPPPPTTTDGLPPLGDPNDDDGYEWNNCYFSDPPWNWSTRTCHSHKPHCGHESDCCNVQHQYRTNAIFPGAGPHFCKQCCDNCKDNGRKDQPCVLTFRPAYHQHYWSWKHQRPSGDKHSYDQEFKRCEPAECHYRPCDNGKHITVAEECDCGWGGRGHTVDGNKKTIGTACDCDQIPTRCCDGGKQASDKDTEDYEYVDPSHAFCQTLLSPASDRTAWTRPFTGFTDKNRWVHRWHLDIFCNKIPTPAGSTTPTGTKTYRTMTSISGVEHGVHIPMEKYTSERHENCQYTRPTGEHHPSTPYYLVPRLSPIRSHVPGGGDWSNYTNRLQFTDNTIAQEGISFCLIGTHYRKSAYAKWEPLIGFLPLAEKSFDIGNHIDPDDSSRMNTFKAPASWELRGTGTDSIWNKPDSLPDHWFENVWLGVLPVGVRPEKGGGISKDPVPLAKGFMKRPAHPEWQPDPECENPYHVSVTTIESDGIHLKNYLHIKVYAQPVSQPFNRRCPTGKIKYLMLEVRDEHGLPVGQFTDDVPCDQDDETIESVLTCPDLAKPCKSYTGTKFNYVPCMFSHPKNNVHPNIFMYTAVKGRTKKTKGPGDTCRDHSKKKDERNPPNTKYKFNQKDYVTEVHATWRFAQLDDGMVSELHFATMIIEDETPVQYFTSRLTHWDGVSETKACVAAHRWKSAKCDNPYMLGTSIVLQDCTNLLNPLTGLRTCRHEPTMCNWCEFDKKRDCCWSYEWGRNYRPGRLQLGLINSCVNDTYNTNRPYGYSAQYKVLKPTELTRGGWDLFRSPWVEPRSVNCHVQINLETEEQDALYRPVDIRDTEKLGVMPLRETFKRFLDHKYRLKNNTYDYDDVFTPPKVERLYDNGEYEDRPPDPSGVRITVTKRDASPRPYLPYQDNFYDPDYRIKFAAYRDVHKGKESNKRKDSRKGVYELGDWHTIGMSKYTDPSNGLKEEWRYKRHIYLAKTPEDAAMKMFDSAHQDPITLKTEFCDQEFREFFGSRYILTTEEREGIPVKGRDKDDHLIRLQTKVIGNDLNFTMKQMALDKRNRCPCPFVPTTPPPEFETKSPREREARKLHFISMMIAWVILVPLAMFVARYFKETYSRVFFMREFWWYAIHVLCLLTALVFTLGGVWVLRYDRYRSEEDYEYVWTDATIVHIASGYILIVVFCLHIMFGWFRFLDYHMRIYQIAFHWLFGWLEYLTAVTCILSSGAIPDGMMNCYVFGIYCCFLIFQAMIIFGMEIHMRAVDNMLNLDPPRAYLPPPMMRVFHTDAPRSKFRITVLFLYFLSLVQFYAYLHMTMRYSEDPNTSCYQPNNADAYAKETADQLPS